MESWSGKVRIAIASIVDNLSLCGLHCALENFEPFARLSTTAIANIEFVAENRSKSRSFSLCPRFIHAVHGIARMYSLEKF